MGAAKKMLRSDTDVNTYSKLNQKLKDVAIEYQQIQPKKDNFIKSSDNITKLDQSKSSQQYKQAVNQISNNVNVPVKDNVKEVKDSNKSLNEGSTKDTIDSTIPQIVEDNNNKENTNKNKENTNMSEENNRPDPQCVRGYANEILAYCLENEVHFLIF